jgi:hypothetical protein
MLRIGAEHTLECLWQFLVARIYLCDERAMHGGFSKTSDLSPSHLPPE